MALIPIDSELKDFKKYLDANDRCIFSARFGDGKSYFLSKFMKKNNKQYLFIPIYPVNYQVAENKDIFEYIKRDILIRLLASGEVEIDDTTISNSIYLYYYLQQNKVDVSSDLLSIAPYINLNGTDISLLAFGVAIKAFDKIKDKFKEYKFKFKNDEQKAQDFIELSKKDKGSIYEFDIISQLICDLVSQYKTKYKNRRKVVLLIEDLDRVDPAHIFRILNIFSAHFDRYDVSFIDALKTQGRNKFNFDKVITVCHYENIKSIYHHLYGENTDFNGYICKFSTSRTFQYSLFSSLKNYLLEYLKVDFIKYPYTCITLIDLILNKYTSDYELWGNLRFIIDNLSKKPLINENYIEIVNGLKISTINDLTKLLHILSCFGLKWSDIGNTNKQTQPELNNIIGNCWLYAKFLDEKLHVTESGGRIACSYKGYGFYGEFNIEVKDSIIVSSNIMRNIFENSSLMHIISAFTNQKYDILNFFSSQLVNFQSKNI